MDKPDFHNHDDSYARRQNPETERNLSMYRSPPRRTLLGCAHLPGCLSPRRLLFVDGWDFPGFVFKRSPALAGSSTQCLINAVTGQLKFRLPPISPVVGSLRFAGFAAKRSYLTLLRSDFQETRSSCAQRPEAPRPEMVF